MTEEYRNAILAHNQAIAKFREVQTAFRERRIDAVEFCIGRKAYDDATAVYDTAYALEAERNRHESAAIMNDLMPEWQWDA